MHVVNTLWVEESLRQGLKVDEGPYELDLHGKLLESPAARGNGKKRRRSMTPRKAHELALDGNKYSSSTQIEKKRKYSAQHFEQMKDEEENVGPATQAAANVLANGLCSNLIVPDVDVDSDADELDTPLSHRCSQRFERMSSGTAKSSASPPGTTVETQEEEKYVVAQRFSLRQLQRRPDRPVLLNKNLPEKPIQPKPLLKKYVYFLHTS